MAFHFSLETIFRLRRSLELQEEQKLAQAVQQAAKIRLQLKNLDDYFQQTQRQWRAELESSNMMPVLHLGVFSQARYLQARENILMELRAAEGQLAEQVRRYQQSRSRRETLQRLRTRHRTLYETQWQRRQQQVIDEMYLSRLRFPPAASLPSE